MTDRTRATLVTLAVVDVVLAFAAARTPWFPGDPQIARAIQHFAPMAIPLAQTITASAMKPWCFLLLAATIAVAWTMCGWRAAAVAVAIFFGLWLLGIWLSPMVAQPRPTSELINVVGHPKGYAFPSIFGLIPVGTNLDCCAATLCPTVNGRTCGREANCMTVTRAAIAT